MFIRYLLAHVQSHNLKSHSLAANSTLIMICTESACIALVPVSMSAFTALGACTTCPGSRSAGHADLQAVIAHELGHLKCSHGVWLTMANVLASNTLSVLPLLSGAIEDGLLRWLRAAELTCDRAALLVAQDHRVVISSLMKLAGGSSKLNAELNVEAFLRQVCSSKFSPGCQHLTCMQSRQYGQCRAASTQGFSLHLP